MESICEYWTTLSILVRNAARLLTFCFRDYLYAFREIYVRTSVLRSSIYIYPALNSPEECNEFATVLF